MSFKIRILSIITLFFLVAVGLNAQVVQLTWTEPTKVLDNNFKPVKVLHFFGAKTSNEDLLPRYELQLYNTAVSNFKLINTIYKPLSEKENLIVKDKAIPSSMSITIGVQNKLPISTVAFVPIRINSQNGTYEKLVSFSYQYDKADFSLQQYVETKAQLPSKSNSKGKIAAVSGSVLASGLWYKVAVNTTGLCKIDYQFLVAMGINPAFINPQYIQIYGNDGGMLPQLNSVSRPDDLQENSIFIAGASDGQFDPGDYILFYAKGPNSWQYNTSESIFNHSKNLYSDKNYYFLTIGSALGKRIQNQAGLGSGAQIVQYYDDYKFYESDLVNLLGSGREWFGETFASNTVASFSFNTEGILPGSSVKLTSAVVGRSVASSSFSVSLNGMGIGSQSIAANNQSQYDAVGAVNRTVFTASSTSLGNPSAISVGLSFNVSSSNAIGHLNYLELNTKKKLALYGAETDFRTVASTSAATTQYYVDNANLATIWQITDLTSVKKQQFDATIGDTAVFSANSSVLEEYVVFSGSNFPSPEFVGQVTNQNLHYIGTVGGIPDMIIVTVPGFVSAALQLASFRKTHDNLDVVVVTTDQVYNEFSSGRQDVSAIRDFMKMLYDRKVPGVDSLSYLLLFGDCSYDYKNRLSGNTNFVPVYQSRQSLYPLESFSSDDYFGLLDPTDGNWSEIPAESNYLDIGVGRIPVKSQDEANTAVTKLIHYSASQSCIGKWRNKLTFTSDDGDGNTHIGHAEQLSDFIDVTYKNFNISKVYLDAFSQVATPGGEKAPEVNEKIIQEVNAGTLILNYSGHGGETGLAQESIIDLPQIEAWDNYNSMPFMITATCDFGRYDDPLRSSGAEIALLRSGGGVISLISSTRIVFANSNLALNEAIYECVFEPINGVMPRLGDVIRVSKNTSILGVNNRNYALLGDPSLRLAYPKHEVVITKINDSLVATLPDTLKALSKVKFEGEVRNSGGTLLSNFTGDITITVYDKKASVSTYGTQGDPPFIFGLRNNYLFNGKASVVNGLWSISFVVPKDISYQFDFGKISAYAYKPNSLTDASGQYSNLIIGGTDPNAPSDNLPPRIKMYMNDESFVFGGLTEKDALFLAQLTDENGINTSVSGVGHEIAATLDNDEKPLVLNQFYTSKLNDYKNGTVKYPYKDLSSGPHSIKLKVWDTYNNSSESYLEFIVASNLKIALSHILNYPNPFSTHTVFHFDHNRSGEDLDVMIQIYTVSGKLIKTLDSKVYSSTSHFMGLDWDGRDDFGDKIGKGVYVYRVWVRAPRDGSSVHRYEKLVILN